jgi:hypothetical protein
MLPRQPLRFLLADDPGAGKTIMAGLLLKELKTRGLVKRTLIVTPANLTFQWQRELKDKFREAFHVVRGDVLRAGYGSNPWAEHDQIITSVSWASIIEDAKESLLRTSWDLVIVDEAHKIEPDVRGQANARVPARPGSLVDLLLTKFLGVVKDVLPTLAHTFEAAPVWWKDESQLLDSCDDDEDALAPLTGELSFGRRRRTR